jgi:arylsulfatase A-like enzyme/Flp pilus assembly protein TadD
VRIRRAAALCVLLLAGCARRETKQPNVLLLTLDTFRADRITAKTANLARLASRSVVFENASSPVPLTLPAHASILSGSLPLHHGLRNNGAGAFPTDRQTLATLFRAAGYRTGAFVSSFVLDHRFGLDRGFDRYDDEVPRDPGNASSYDAERRGADTIDRAVAWLKGGDARPTFTWVHLYDAHAPYAPPQPYPQTYDGEIAYVDAQLQRLLALVDANTVAVIVGDHGEGLGEHGELTHGLLLYEPTLHVPMFIAAPGAKARVIREPVSTIDLAPTIASLARVPFEGKTDGIDRSKEVLGDESPRAADIYAETQYPAIFGWSDLAMLRRGNIKYIAAPSPELYDVAHDRGEARNVLAEERRSYRSLSAELDAMRATAAAPSNKPSPLDEEAKAKLASLGYIAPPALTNASGPRADPKAMAPLFRQFEEATWAMNAGRLDDAIARFRPIVASDVRNPVFRASLARALRQKGELASAITLYQEAVAITPDDPEAWYNLAVALQEANRVKESGIAIREAVRRDPRRPEAHNALGISFSEAGDLRAAEAEFAKASGIDPHDARAFNNLGNVYRATGRIDDALAAYQRAATLAPRYADPLNGLGVIAVQRNDPRGALVHFDRALEIAPNFYEAQLNRGIALQIAGDRDGATRQFRKLLAELPAGAAFEAQRHAATQLLAGLRK